MVERGGGGGGVRGIESIDSLSVQILGNTLIIVSLITKVFYI